MSSSSPASPEPSPEDSLASSHARAEPEVGTRNWISLAGVLWVQTQNAFNDNFVKMVLMGLALAVAAGTKVGDNIQFILAALIPIPFILLAPISGYFSDRFSKSRVILFCLILQVVIFAIIAIAIVSRQVGVAIFGYFLLAVQSTLFSPAKFGILKELVGSKRLGMANGLMQMLTMGGILGGMYLGGDWFDSLLQSKNEADGVSEENAWKSALTPVLVIGGISLIPLLISRSIQKTPAHPATEYSPTIWVRHFVHLGYLFRHRVLRVTALRLSFYWFTANFMALAFLAFGKELHPDLAEGGASSETAQMMLKTGAGLILGSSLVSFLSRGGIRLGLVPIGGFGMALGLLGIGTFAAGSLPWSLSIGVVGFFSGFFLVPLTAHLQDQAEEAHRGRVLSANNLLTSLSGVVAIAAGMTLDHSGFSASSQVIALILPLLVVTAFTLGFLRRPPAGASPE